MREERHFSIQNVCRAAFVVVIFRVCRWSYVELLDVLEADAHADGETIKHLASTAAQM